MQIDIFCCCLFWSKITIENKHDFELNQQQDTNMPLNNTWPTPKIDFNFEVSHVFFTQHWNNHSNADLIKHWKCWLGATNWCLCICLYTFCSHLGTFHIFIISNSPPQILFCVVFSISNITHWHYTYRYCEYIFWALQIWTRSDLHKTHLLKVLSINMCAFLHHSLHWCDDAKAFKLIIFA